MKQQLAFDRSIVPVLRPSLRVAFDIVQEFGSLSAALEDVERVNLSTMASLVRIASTDQRGVSNFLHGITTYGLKHLPLIRPIFIKLIHDLIENPFGIDTTKAKPERTAKSEPEQTPIQYYRRLFQLGTGVLGWTPDQTWNATPAEITMAYHGRTEFVSDILQAVFGTAEDKPQSGITPYDDEELAQIEKNGVDPNFDRTAFNDLRMAL